VCDRCGRLFNHKDLTWQYNWRGNRLANLNILVCQRCLEDPSDFLRIIKIPAEPAPTLNARPEPYYIDNASQSTLLPAPPGVRMFPTAGTMRAQLLFNRIFFPNMLAASSITGSLLRGVLLNPSIGTTASISGPLSWVAQPQPVMSCTASASGTSSYRAQPAPLMLTTASMASALL